MDEKYIIHSSMGGDIVLEHASKYGSAKDSHDRQRELQKIGSKNYAHYELLGEYRGYVASAIRKLADEAIEGLDDIQNATFSGLSDTTKNGLPIKMTVKVGNLAAKTYDTIAKK